MSYSVAALYVDALGPYPAIAEQWFDIERDATKYSGCLPVVAHPPCRSWSRLKHFAKPLPGEKELALHALEMVRTWGGVLEHPAGSSLWPDAGLPRGSNTDRHGGWTITVDQNWWGHKARKRTHLYIVGIHPAQLPAIPLDLAEPSHTLGLNSKRDRLRARPDLPKIERHLSPPAFAHWLCQVAVSCRNSQAVAA